MNWIQKLEQKRFLLVVGMVTICVAALVVSAQRKPVSLDSYWHLQTGLDWIQKGLSPWVDHFSFTFSGEPISSQPVIFQVVLAGLVDNLGLELGYGIIKLTAFLLAIGLMLLHLKRLNSPVVLYLVILPLMTLLLELRAAVRPELFSYSISIIAVLLYHRANRRVNASTVLPIAALMLFWTNYHTSTLGYVLFFGLFLDVATQQFIDKKPLSVWLRWVGWGLLVVGVGFLNKGFHHPLVDAWYFSPEWKGYIQEYVSASLYKNVLGIYSLFAVAIAIIILAVKCRRLGYVVVVLVFAYSSMQMARLVTPCGIILLAMLASLVNRAQQKEQSRLLTGISGQAVSALVILAILTPLYSSVALARDFIREGRTSALIRPENITGYMRVKKLTGRIYNEYGIGGYLIRELAPDSTVYIDGRTNILYPAGHYARFLSARNNPLVLKEEIDKYGIDYALLESNQRAYSVTYETGELHLDFADYSYSLFRRGESNFPVTGRLLAFPACWDESYRSALEGEYARAMSILPLNSSLLPSLRLMVGYSTQDDRLKFLKDFADSGSGTTFQLRFAAYQAMSIGEFELAADFFSKLQVWDLDEFLAVAISNVRLEQWHTAEEIVDSMTKIQWPRITPNDTLLLYLILESIRQHGSLETVPEDYVDMLHSQIENLGVSADVLELDYTMLCTN